MRLDHIEEEFFGVFLSKNPNELLTQDKAEQKKIQSAKAKHQIRYNELTKDINTLLELTVSMDMAELKTRLAKLNVERAEEKQAMDELDLQAVKVDSSPKEFEDLKTLLAELRADKQGAMEAFDDAMVNVMDGLQDNELRKKISVMLPSVIGKMVVNTSEGQFEIFNHSGRSIYRSMPV
jgi:hypothetical protein